MFNRCAKTGKLLFHKDADVNTMHPVEREQRGRQDANYHGSGLDRFHFFMVRDNKLVKARVKEVWNVARDFQTLAYYEAFMQVSGKAFIFRVEAYADMFGVHYCMRPEDPAYPADVLKMIPVHYTIDVEFIEDIDDKPPAVRTRNGKRAINLND